MSHVPCPNYTHREYHLHIENITHSIEKCKDSEVPFLLIILLLLFSQPCPMFHVLTIHIEREYHLHIENVTHSIEKCKDSEVWFSFNNTFTTVFTTMSHVPCPNYTHRERYVRTVKFDFLLIILLLLFSQPCPMFHVLTIHIEREIHLLIQNITHSIEKERTVKFVFF